MIVTAIAPLKKQWVRERKEALGQFLTPSPIGDFMASFFEELPAVIRVVDAGAGTGELTAALVRRACQPGSGVRSIRVDAYELDRHILPALEKTIARCEEICREKEIWFDARIHHVDFILDISRRLAGEWFNAEPPSFNLAIANPPYKKIGVNSAERLALRGIGLETSNLYTGFVGVLARLLEDDGQMVAITPRSFCNGPYFRPFREDFLDRMTFRRLHVFESRKDAFREEGVLQENVIFHAVKSQVRPSVVSVSCSRGSSEDSVIIRDFSYNEIVHLEDPEQFIHIPVDHEFVTARNKIAKLSGSLASLGMNVSTGRVVDFRLKDALCSMPAKGTVPLLYPCHFNGGTVHWPRESSRKPNAILLNEETRPWLVPSGIYLLVKRFTSKEERRRVVACLFDPSEVESEWLGFENHLNYFHSNGKSLDRGLALGLLVYLNSTLVDQYFRSFSGHTQVNVTDLRQFAYPERSALIAMGESLTGTNLNQEEVDRIVAKFIS